MNNLLKVVGLGVFILIVYTIYNNRLTPEELIEKKRIEDSISIQNKKMEDSLHDLKINESLKKITIPEYHSKYIDIRIGAIK